MPLPSRSPHCSRSRNRCATPCEAETSMMMAVRPELVAEDRIALVAQANRTPELVDVVGGGGYRWRSLGSMSSAGVIGHPEAASRAKAERLIEEIADTLAQKLGNPELWALPWQSDPVQDQE